MDRAHDPWPDFLRNAIVWLIPALLLLPLYLIIIAISALANEGALLECFEGTRGRIRAALGPLLILSGCAMVIATVAWAGDAEAFLNGGAAAVVCLVFGVVLIRRELARMRGQQES